MSFIPFTLPDGTANPPAMFVNATLIQGLYNSSISPFQAYASAVGGTVTAFISEADSYPPDYGCIRIGNDVLLVLAGTTNKVQWAYHVASAVFPAFDFKVQSLVVGSFHNGLVQIENTLTSLTDPATSGRLYIAGHSYGAAAANILAVHLQKADPDRVIHLMTFGEPYSYGTPSALPELSSHNKIVACITDDFSPVDPVGIDPVSLSPPDALQFLKFAFSIPLIAGILGLKWKTSGIRQILTQNRLYPPFIPSFDPQRIPFVASGQFVSNLPYALEHFVNPSYLQKSLDAYQRGPAIPSLDPLVNIALQNLGLPSILPQNLAPEVPAAIINSGWELPADTITEVNRTTFSTVSLVGQLSFPGESTMPLSPYVQPTFKGTLFFDQDGGGSSESFYAAPPNAIAPTPSVSQAGAAPATYPAMLTAMKNVAQARLKLSQTEDNNLCNNPLKILAMRIENEQVNRDSLLTPNPGIFGPGFTSGGSSIMGGVSNENDDINAAYKVNLADGNGHTAIYYLHGVPLYSQVVGVASSTVPPTAFMERTTVINPSWQQNLWAFCNALILNGLGFRYQWVCWTPGGVPFNGYPGTGNGSPLAVYYNFPGKPLNTYTFQMPTNPPPGGGQPAAALCQNPVGRFRIIVRSMKQLRVLNGRWPAFGFSYAGGVGLPPLGYYVNVGRRAANYLLDNTGAYDSEGYLSPEVWSVTQPAPSPPLVSTALVGISNPILTSKKVGRPFDLERGRRRNQVT